MCSRVPETCDYTVIALIELSNVFSSDHILLLGFFPISFTLLFSFFQKAK